jgi:hypothetical protein
VVTGELVYLPLSGLFVVLGLREGLFTSRFLLAAITIAAIVHTLEVGHHVYKRW